MKTSPAHAGDSDAKVAYDAAYLLAGRLGARVQFELLRAQTADLLQRPRAVRLVRALADELMRHETLGGEDVRRVLERAETRQARPDRVNDRDLYAGATIEPWPTLRCRQTEP
jgi:hypothetical protein